MGNQPNQPSNRQKPADLDDQIIQMKIQSKQIARAGKNSQKESAKYMKKAKQSMKKNNEQGAKLYLVSASQKKNEALNYQRAAVKMQIMCDRIKSMKNNQQLVGTFNNMSQAISQQMGQMDAVKMADSMGMLNEKMDQVMINNKMMNQVMTQNDSVQNNTVDQMMNVLKQEIHLQETGKLDIDYVPQNNVQINNNNNQQQKQVYGGNNSNNNNNGGQKQEEGYDPFLDQLKDL